MSFAIHATDPCHSESQSPRNRENRDIDSEYDSRFEQGSLSWKSEYTTRFISHRPDTLITDLETASDPKVQNKIIRETSKHYLNNPGDLTAVDLITITTVKEYAKQSGFSDLNSGLDKLVDDYFENFNFDHEVIMRAIDQDGSIPPQQALEIFESESENIRDAIQQTYDGSDIEIRQKAIKKEKNEFLAKLISAIEV